MKKYFVYMLVLSAVITICAIPAFSQEAAKQEANKEAVSPAVAAPAAPEPAKASELSIYGEVQAVVVPANSMTVQYYDYDNDEEKSIEIISDKDTKMENVRAISEIKKGDWVDVTYTASSGKNIAKIISVEKEEPVQEEAAPAAADE